MNNKFRIATLAATVAATVSTSPLAMAQALEEVIITAQRRVENMQDVALAVTSVSGDELMESRVFDVGNIEAISPSISFRTANMASSSSNIQIRGIGTTGAARVFEGAVGVFIDGIYRSRSGQALAQFLDIQQLQVLRGPQGTLFGKNTSAGAILLDSVRPDVEALSGMIGIEAGNYSHYLARGVINTPLGDDTAFRLAAVKTQRDGYFDNPNAGTLNDHDSVGYKAQLLHNFSDTTEIRIIGDYSEQDDDCCYATWDAVNGPLRPYVDSLVVANGLKAPSKKESDYEAVLNSKPKNHVKDYGIGVYAETELDAGTLRYIGAARVYKVDQSQADGDFSGADLLNLDESFKSEFYSSEVSFSGQLEGRVEADYVIGGYYSTENLKMGRNLYWGEQAQPYWDTIFEDAGAPAGIANAAPGLLSQEKMEANADSVAVFTQWDFTLSDKINLILGARYSRDQKDGSFANPYFRDPQFDPLALAGVMPGILYGQDYDDDSWSGTVIFKYQLTDDIMTYTSFNRGYKSGGINTDVSAAGTPGSVLAGTPEELKSPQFESETTDAYEIGLKADWLEGAARTNMAVFYNDLSDLQIASFSGLTFGIVNAPSAESYGAEIEQMFQLNDVLTLSSAVTWLPKAEYGDAEILGNLADRRFPTAPKIAANLALAADYPITSQLYLKGRIETVHTGKVYTSSTSDLEQDAVTRVNATMALGSNDSGWQIGAYVQNLTNQTYVVSHLSTPLQSGSLNAYLGNPRTYGVTAKYSF